MTATPPRKSAAARGAPAGPAPDPAPRERELKLRLRPQDVAALRARLDARATPRTQVVDSIYLDTADRRLARARAALRLRAVGPGRRRWVQTLKTGDDGAAFSSRGEWETPAPGGRLSPGRLAGTPLAQLLATGGGSANLLPVFRTRFTRTTWDIVAGDAHVEVAIDEGRIEAGAAHEDIREVELELKRGPAAAVWTLAIALSTGGAVLPSGRLALLPYGDSKAARGYRLAAGVVPGPQGAGTACALDPGLGVVAAARALVAHDMIGVLANAARVGAGEDPEFIHQARVGLRRMRANLDVLDAPLPPALERGLRQLSDRFGRVRDWDVLCEALLPRMIADLGAGADERWALVLGAARRRRAAAAAQLRRGLDGPDFAALALRLLQWSSGDAADTRKDDERPVGAAAARAVRKRLRRLAEAGRDFARHSPERQHRIRLQAKTVRYAIDALGPLLPRRVQGPVRRALARFQEAAGRAQDAQVAVAAVHRLSRSAVLRREAAVWAAANRARPVAKAQRLAARLSA